MTADLLKGLNFIHKEESTHRDLKPITSEEPEVGIAV